MKKTYPKKSEVIETTVKVRIRYSTARGRMEAIKAFKSNCEFAVSGFTVDFDSTCVDKYSANSVGKPRLIAKR